MNCYRDTLGRYKALPSLLQSPASSCSDVYDKELSTATLWPHPRLDSEEEWQRTVLHMIDTYTRISERGGELLRDTASASGT